MPTKIIQDLQTKYCLSPDSYYKEGVNPYKVAISFEDTAAYESFKKKWMPFTEAGWYGPTGLGYPMPRIWYQVLDEFLDWCLTTEPNFKILQIAVKFGYVKIYLVGIDWKITLELTRLLSDKKLIY